MLCRQFESPDGRSMALQLVIPQKLRKEVLTDLHKGPLGSGQDPRPAARTVLLAWLPRRCTELVPQLCSVCHSAPKARAPLTGVKTGYPMQLVAMDILGPFPQSEAGNSYILVVADYFTRWTEQRGYHRGEEAHRRVLL